MFFYISFQEKKNEQRILSNRLLSFKKERKSTEQLVGTQEVTSLTKVVCINLTSP